MRRKNRKIYFIDTYFIVSWKKAGDSSREETQCWTPGRYMADEIPSDLRVLSVWNISGVLMEPAAKFALTQILNCNKNKMGHDFKL